MAGNMGSRWAKHGYLCRFLDRVVSPTVTGASALRAPRDDLRTKETMLRPSRACDWPAGMAGAWLAELPDSCPSGRAGRNAMMATCLR